MGGCVFQDSNGELPQQEWNSAECREPEYADTAGMMTEVLIPVFIIYMVSLNYLYYVALTL